MAHSKGERVTKYAYDLSGNLIRVTAPDGSVTTYRYDALNRPVRVIDALGNETTYGYDAMDRLVSARQPNGATIRLAYDTVGNLLSETDALGAKQTFAYDALGRLQEVTDALGHRTAYGYDALDNLTLVRDANGNETRYKYDSLSRLRSETDALGNTTQYEYTPEGWLKETKRPDGTTLSYDYDRTGRLLKESASDGTEIRHDFDAMGQLTEIEDETGTTKLRYDERGLLIGVENPLGDVVQYEYNQYAEKTCLIYPDGKRAEYAYDSMSRLLSVTEPNGTTTAYTYDALGRRTRTSDSTLTTEYGYDAVGNLVRQVNENVTLTYRYDLNNRMTEEARTEGGTTLRSGFAYDKAGQLTSFRRSDGYAEAYTYDPVGNMVEKVLNGTKIAMTYDAANELKTMESPHGKLVYAYDLNGNLTQKTLGNRTDTYSYDARNRLKQYRGYDNYEVKYSYNALGMLHSRESSGNHSRTTLEELIAGKEDSDDPDGDGEAHLTTYVYDLTQPYYEVLTETADGAVTAYTYGLERLAAYTEQTQTKYLYDGRGSVIQTRGSLGTQTKAYSAFGELLTEKVSGYGYNGEYYDAATGMLNLRARQYEPAQARFSQRDSLKGWVTSPRSLNAYLYCQNDAINFLDASGAAMMAVNMTDGGGGRKSDTSSSSLFQKAGQTIKTAVTQAVNSAAAIVKQANEKANPTAKSKGEAIVVSGSKQTSKFAYNFIESGIKGIKAFKDQGQTNITWLVFSYLYSSDDLMNFETTASSLGVSFEVINSNQEFINYLNTGDKNTKEGVRDQKITNMVIYGHGYPGEMSLGNKRISAQYLEEQLNGASFDNTKTVLYTCRAANKNADGVILAQTISSITQGETKAMNGKVDYAYIAYTREEMNIKNGLMNELISAGKLYLSSVILSPPMPYGNYSYYMEYYYNEQALRKRMWDLLELKLQDDEIEVLRKEFGYMQDGARYDPIPGKQAQPQEEEDNRDPAYWEEFSPQKP